jgi:hypothetical protein
MKRIRICMLVLAVAASGNQSAMPQVPAANETAKKRAQRNLQSRKLHGNSTAKSKASKGRWLRFRPGLEVLFKWTRNQP